MDNVKDIVLQYLPNTLLLVGTAYLLIFMVGIPLPPSLSRKYGDLQDRLFSFLAPLSSIPSWVHGVLLILILAGAVLTTAVSMIVAATGVWFGGWVDALIQRITEVNMILPMLAICGLLYALFSVSLRTILGIIILLNVFNSPTKAFRAAFLQVKETPYIEAAQAYGVSNWRIICCYMIPRIILVFIPQLVVLIPSYVFLEATRGMFNIKSNYPTWGKAIYDALKQGVSWGSRFWVLEPIGLLLLTGFAFAMVGFALDRILNPRLRSQ